MEKIDLSNNFIFSALRGIQGKKEYYVAMCPLKIIPRVFLFNEAELPPKLRSQRKINKSRIPEMANYLIKNMDSYVFSSLTASIDGKVEFVPVGPDGHLSRVGTLVVPMDSKFIINDGQHRRAAIEKAIKEKPELGFETISVVFYLDKGLKNSQQMFSDLNHHAVKPTKSLNILYDGRDVFSKELLSLINQVPIFSDDLTEFEKTSISNRQNKVFTLNSIYHSTRDLLGKKGKINTLNTSEKQIIQDFWREAYVNMPNWKELVESKVTPFDMREKNMSVYGITLHAIGKMGNSLFVQKKESWKNVLKKLKTINWSRTNPEWQNRAIVNGKLSKSSTNVTLTSNLIKQKLGLELTPREIEIEKLIGDRK